jgi:hypothetical protein
MILGMRNHSVTFTRSSIGIAIVILVMSGCATDARTGALSGTGLGALVGQAIGNDTESTLIGAGVGAGLGYIIGNERDKREAAQKSPSTYSYPENDVLEGTRWRVISVNPQPAKRYESKIVEFKSGGRVSTITTEPGGYVSSTEEQYRVVGDTLVVNKPDYVINAKFRISGNQLILSADNLSAVLEKI